MNINLVHLIELQKTDTEMQKILHSRKELPVRLAKLEESFQTLKEGMEEERNRLEMKFKAHRELEDSLKKGVEQLRKTRDRVHDVKSNKEYQAVLKEIETLEQKNGTVEDKIIAILEEIDGLKTFLSGKDQEFEAAKKSYEGNRAEIERQLGSIEAQLRDRQRRGEELRAKIPKELLKKYDIIKNVSQGLAVVSAWRETCDGCHMNIPPQLYNELLEETEELIMCPNCRRIIFWYDQNSKEEV